jgi:putative sigma-54 modulation protein
MDTTDAIKKYAEDKVLKIKKYFPDPINAHVVLSTEKYRQKADINITLHNGLVLKGKESTEDVYSSIDRAVDKIERQVRKYKDKIKRHKPQNGPQIPVRHNILQAAEALQPREEMPEPVPKIVDEEKIPRVVRTSEFSAKPMTVEEALMQLDLRNSTFLVFTNADSRAINVVYRREDGNYGLIETDSKAI